MKKFNCIIMMLFFTALMLCIVVPTYAATFIVTNTNDSGAGSLRQAINDANANTDADTINFSITGTITLASSLTQIVYSTTINGPGSENLTVDGASAYRLFFFSGPMVPPSQTFHISGLTLTGGSAAQGGAISLAANQTLTVDSCIISGNEATINGGGISCWGTSTLTIQNCIVSDNDATTSGGGIYSNSSNLTVQNSTISGNDATTTSGGGILIEGSSSTTIDNVTISSNTASSSGGGISNHGISLNISNSTISDNGPVNSGGGIYNGGGGMMLTNVTISGNTANVGGGISSASSTLTLINVTICNNTGNNNGSGIYNSGTVTFQNAIIANNLGPGNNCGNAGGTFTSSGHNLDSENTCVFNQLTDIINTDPLLGILYENGGDTKTHALLLNSPAIDAGENYSGTPTTDQRGFLRPQDGDGDGNDDKDIGAFEVFTGTVSLPRTGQTSCWDENGNPCTCGASGCSGHDGGIQAGVAWPSPRFTDNGDCVTDNLTGLVWVKSPLANLRTWTEALSYADSLTLSGHDDWRLPNINELESLVNAQEPDQSAWLNTQGFTNVQPNYYWSSTTLTLDTTRALYVPMWDGRVHYSNATKADSLHAWPVRTGQQDKPDTDYPANQWKTGQTLSYDPVDDGAFQMGIMTPSSFRLTDNGDGTVTDNLTGLMWLKDANCMETHYAGTWPDGYANWQEASEIIAGINDGTYAGCSAGHTDWRLPNRKELHSLTDFSQSNPALPQGHPFVNVGSDPGHGYLTSTTCAHAMEDFWGVSIYNGTVSNAFKLTSTNWILPVRAGLSGNGNNGGSGGGGSSGGGCFINTSADLNSK